jgi:hypothetical protein
MFDRGPVHEQPLVLLEQNTFRSDNNLAKVFSELGVRTSIRVWQKGQFL